MYIYEVIPLTTIPRPNPQVLSYYYAKRLDRFSLVEIPLGKRLYPGVVLGGKQVKDLKSVLRKAYFQVKEIKRVIQQGPILFDWQFTLVKWISDYYWSSLGLVLKKMIPKYILALHVTPKESKLPTGQARYELHDLRHKSQVLWLFPDNSFFQKIELPVEFTRISSRITEKKEFQIFRKIISGKGRYILGTKRVLFAPFNRLKEVHIFEEADASHKSWEQHPKYNAVRVAEELARLHGAKVMYRSTLPSLHNYSKGIQYHEVEPPKEVQPPKIEIIDLAKEKLKKPFSDEVAQALRDCYVSGKQAILYVNRRGEGRFLLCRDCGFVPKCPNCELSLVFHIKHITRILLCHHCGYKEAPPSLCSQCGSHEIRSYGFGTQRVESELVSLFPKAKVFRLDSDTALHHTLKQDIMEQFKVRGNFLVATSMIFQARVEPVHLIASLNPDSEFNIPDFAQNERLFFNLWRLNDLAKGFFYIQTYNPSVPLFGYLQKADWQGFFKEELKIRKALNYPPSSSIIKLTFAHRSEAKAREEAQILHKNLQQVVKSQLSHSAQSGMAKRPVNCQFLGPAPAFLPKLKGKYRYNILVKLKATLPPKAAVLLASLKLWRSGRRQSSEKLKANLLSIVPSAWDIDVDPIDSL